METPVTSLGSMSGVNWMRLNDVPNERASALASMVFPTPGTSSMSRWPWHSKPMTVNCTSALLPTMTFSTLAIKLWATDWTLIGRLGEEVVTVDSFCQRFLITNITNDRMTRIKDLTADPGTCTASRVSAGASGARSSQNLLLSLSLFLCALCGEINIIYLAAGDRSAARRCTRLCRFHCERSPICPSSGPRTGWELLPRSNPAVQRGRAFQLETNSRMKKSGRAEWKPTLRGGRGGSRPSHRGL